MKIGYQGEENCYSYQVLKNYLSTDLNSKGYKNFEDVFEGLYSEDIDFAILPIENSLGGCIFVNYDLFYKYNIKIHCEFHHEIRHSLYSLTKNIDNLETVISHPQALQQCYNNIRKHKLKPVEFWDTTGSIKEIYKKNDITVGCIAPPNLENGIFEIKKNFNDQENNITRFYLISIRKRNLFHLGLLNHNLEVVVNKFSGYVTSRNKLGILSDYLQEFKYNDCDLTKIESRPYLGKDREVFSYIFYLEGVNRNDKIQNIHGFENFGYFPLLSEGKILKSSKIEIKIGIIGFGRFGQFIGKEMVKYGFDVFATSRTDYTVLAEDIGISFFNKDEFLCLNLDIIILATSILSFEQVIKSFPKQFWKKKLIVDVLSVKSYPHDILTEYFPENNILLTHPMFGPDSANTVNGWNNKNFVYWEIIRDEDFFIDKFLDFWKFQGCNMIEMSPDEHDKLTANSQFLTHFIGRTLELLNCQNTNVDTEGFKSLVKIKEHSVNDSWDLFYALAKYNPKSLDTISKLKYQLNKLEEKLLFPDGKEVKQSETSKMFAKIVEMKKQNIDVINSAIGVPSWYPKIDYNSLNLSSEYTTSKGNSDLLNNLIKYYYDKHEISLDNDNLVIVSGGKPGIYLSLNLLTNVSSKWLVPKPYWTSYPDMIQLLSGETIFLESDNCYLFKLEDVENNFKNEMVNGIIICNPNNPTGYVYPKNFLISIVNLCKKYDKYIIVDEVYLPLTNNTTLFSENYNKMIVISSFAKYWALPGWRVGWILAESSIISKLVKLQSTIMTCAPNSSQIVCNHLLESNFKPELTVLDKSRNILRDIFIEKGWNLINSDKLSMYLFPTKNVNIKDVVENLLNNGLAVINGKCFGINDGFRLTLPNSEILLEKISKILEKEL